MTGRSVEAFVAAEVLARHRLEFPVVILADLTAKLQASQARRYIDTDRSLCAGRIGGWSPLELTNHETEEIARDTAEGVRLAYVAATRARDLLVVPVVGDPWGRINEFWTAPLARSVYPLGELRKAPREAPGCPKFGRDSVNERPPGVVSTADTVCPGRYAFGLSESYEVVWDPTKLALGARPSYALRQEDFLKEIDKATVQQDLAAYRDWESKKAALIEAASVPSLRVQTITQRAARTLETSHPIEVKLINIGKGKGGPGGARYGSLVHAMLATVPLTAGLPIIQEIAALHGKILDANPEEVLSAVGPSKLF
jgi:ATP-dependent helicase/nuclease subunit A